MGMVMESKGMMMGSFADAIVYNMVGVVMMSW